MNRMIGLPVTNSSECWVVLATLADACSDHPRNPITAGPTAVRRVCGLMEEGKVTGTDAVHQWCRAVRFLTIDESSGFQRVNANVPSFLSAGGLDMILNVMDNSYDASNEVTAMTAGMAVFLVRAIASFSPGSRAEVLSAGYLKRVCSIMAAHPRAADVQRLGCLAFQFIAEPVAGQAPDWACSTSHEGCHCVQRSAEQSVRRDGCLHKSP